jgi:hypothetical protein
LTRGQIRFNITLVFNLSAMDGQDMRQQIKVLAMMAFTRITGPWTDTTTPSMIIPLCQECDCDRVRACLLVHWVCDAPSKDECRTRAGHADKMMNEKAITFAAAGLWRQLLCTFFMLRDHPEAIDAAGELGQYQFDQTEEAEAAARGYKASHLPLVVNLAAKLQEYARLMGGDSAP